MKGPALQDGLRERARPYGAGEVGTGVIVRAYAFAGVQAPVKAP